MEESSIRIVDPTVRDKCLEGFTFVLGSLSKVLFFDSLIWNVSSVLLICVLCLLQYKFGEKLQSLLEVVGAKVISLDVFSSDSQVRLESLKFFCCLICSHFHPTPKHGSLTAIHYIFTYTLINTDTNRYSFVIGLSCYCF